MEDGGGKGGNEWWSQECMYSSPLCKNVWVCMYGYVRTLAREIKMECSNSRSKCGGRLQHAAMLWK